MKNGSDTENNSVINKNEIFVLAIVILIIFSPFLYVTPLRGLLGLFISIVIGGIAVNKMKPWLYPKPKENPNDNTGVESWKTGVVERVFFTFLVAIGTSGYPIAMIGWITAKMAANWNLQKPFDGVDAHRISALLRGLGSMLFAIIGGKIINADSVWIISCIDQHLTRFVKEIFGCF